MFDTFTFGAELEFADVRYGQPLPRGCSWNKEDGSIVNSSSVANCPKGKLWPYGGEINTRPTDTMGEQLYVFLQILDVLNPRPVINYRCNLHIHIGIRGLRDDLPALKKLLTYIDTWQETVYKLIEPIPEPTHEEYPEPDAYAGAIKRYRRRFQSHQSKLTPSQVSKMLAAKTTSEFYLAHFYTDYRGTPMKHLHQRCGINLRSLWENDETIEFRHFPGTINAMELESALRWCELFLKGSLINATPRDIINTIGTPKFPAFKPYQHELEVGYQKTNYHLKIEERRQGIREITQAAAQPVGL